MSLYEAYDENGNFTGRWCPSVKQANLQNTRTVSIVGNAATQSRNKYLSVQLCSDTTVDAR